MNEKRKKTRAKWDAVDWSKTDTEIAREMMITPKAVEDHRLVRTGRAATKSLIDVVDAVRHLTKEKGYPPSQREIAAHLGRTPFSIGQAVARLREMGYVTGPPNTARSLCLADS